MYFPICKLLFLFFKIISQCKHLKWSWILGPLSTILCDKVLSGWKELIDGFYQMLCFSPPTTHTANEHCLNECCTSITSPIKVIPPFIRLSLLQWKKWPYNRAGLLWEQQFSSTFVFYDLHTLKYGLIRWLVFDERRGIGGGGIYCIKYVTICCFVSPFWNISYHNFRDHNYNMNPLVQIWQILTGQSWSGNLNYLIEKY